MAALDAFLAGERPDDVALFLSDSFVDDLDALDAHGERVDPTDDRAHDGGLVLVVDGERGRSVFKRLTGVDAMAFAGSAMDSPGTVTANLAGGDCPNAAGGPQSHRPEFVFAFAEERNEAAGGIYAEGDVVHAYAYCACGHAYSDRWVVGERADAGRDAGSDGAGDRDDDEPGADR